MAAIHLILVEWDSTDEAIANAKAFRTELLESAVLTCRQPYYKGFFLKSAALLRSLVKNHPFIDGNKRTALLSLQMFLLRNGYVLDTTDKQLIQFVLRIAKGYIRDLHVIKSWIKRRSRCKEKSHNMDCNGQFRGKYRKLDIFLNFFDTLSKITKRTEK